MAEAMMKRGAATALVGLAAALIAAADVTAQEPNFGRAMVMTGAELFVGQPVNWYGPGVVYAYRLDGGAWQEAVQLTAPDSARMDDFGRTLAVDGNTLVVGAPRKRDGSGVAYVYTRASAGAPWRHAHTLAPPAGADGREYAASLWLRGDELLVGAPAVDTAGAVYHYRRAGGAWTLAHTIRAPRGVGAVGFGAAVARAGADLLVGAPRADSARGHLYAARLANNTWTAPERVALPREADAPGARAGTAVTVAGDVAWIGAPGAATVFVLQRTGSEWSATEALQPFDGGRGSNFGYAIEPVGSELWVGAPGVNRSNGRVYRFLREGDAWAGSLRLDADSADATAWPFGFGYAIAAAGERAVVSMPSRDFGEGRVLALARSGDEWTRGGILEGRIYRIGSALEPGMRCAEGALSEFPCSNIELVSHMPIDELGGARGAWVNDVWGWTDPQTSRMYALVARRDGASFVDVTNPSAPRLVGTMDRTVGSPPSVWRDIKVIGNHAYIVADGAGAHGMQVFDLTRLRGVTGAARKFEPDATYREIFSAHNVVADTASKFLYVVGANSGGNTCGGGLHMVDASDPVNPVFAGCYHDASGTSRRGYTHDAQCVTYAGPDERYRGRQICVGSNESEINIADVTDKSRPVTVGRNSYPNVAYAHQGWFDDEQRYFYMNDELDELAGLVPGTRTLVWDLTELDDPVLVHEYIAPVRASDHNLFVVGDRVYESNYGSGLRVLDISNREAPREIAFFDSAPYNDNEPGHSSSESGAWSNYPFFGNGLVVFTSVREGLFIVRVVEGRPVM